MTRAAAVLPAGYRLRHHGTLRSTNDEAKALARAGEPAGTVVWADAQTAGRGRRGRTWVSPRGNLYCTLILRPRGAPAVIAQLGFAAALAVGETLVPSLGDADALRYKWPNDVLVNGRKIAGILLESETSAPEAVDFVVVGIGVNLASAPPATEYPATSLAAERAAPLAPGRVLEMLVRYFDDWYRRWCDAGFAPVRAAWLARAGGLGEDVRVRLERVTHEGRFLDLDAEGALILEQPAGTRRIAAGEVFPAIG